MAYMLATSFSLLLAVLVNSCSVYMQRRRGVYDKFRHGQLVHAVIILPFWLLFGFLASTLNMHYKLPGVSLPGLGYVLAVSAAVIFIAAVYILGPGSLINSNFFRPGAAASRGIYRYFKNPIYDSYWVFFLALGFVTSNSAFFIIAGLSFIGLNVIESRIERI
ncbi:methyltransferase [Mycobacterium sp.]|uniref:methyltransferase n=1 Tax=Mycobacterium sp. TaxID=1785 RepID=UPI0031CEFC15